MKGDSYGKCINKIALVDHPHRINDSPRSIGKEVEQVKFTIDVDIDIDEISQKVAEKAEKKSYSIVEERMKSRLESIIENGAYSNTLLDKLGRIAESRFQYYIKQIVDQIFEYNAWNRGDHERLLKIYLNDHIQNKVSEIIDTMHIDADDYKVDPSEYREELITKAARELVHGTKMNKSVIEKLANAIVRIQEEAKECEV